MIKFFNSNKYACIASAVALIIMVLTLFCLKIGVADNGYLTPRLVSMGLYDAQGASGTGYYSTGFGVADKSFSFAPGNLVYSFVKLFFAKDTVIPTALPALVYMIFAIFGIFMIVKALTTDMKWNNILLCVITVLIACDTGYISYFNTPYECGAAIAYFIPMIGALLMSIRFERIRDIILFAIFGILFSGTMPQSGAVGVFVALFALYLVFKHKSALKKALLVACGIMILMGSTLSLSSMTDGDKYNSVFYGVASSDNSACSVVLSDLKIIGKDELCGKTYFEPEAQEFINSPEFSSVMKNVNPWSVAKMYAKNPQHMRNMIKSAGANSMFIKTEYLGNYPASSGKPSMISGFFSAYSSIKKALVPGNIVAIIVIFAFIVFFAFDYKRKYALTDNTKNACLLCAFLCVAALISLVVPVIYYGVAQISFNLIIYNLIFDFLVGASAVGGTKLLTVRRNILREKFGVNQ